MTGINYYEDVKNIVCGFQIAQNLLKEVRIIYH